MSLVASGYIITRHGIIVIQGSPQAIQQAGGVIASGVGASLQAGTNPDVAMTALELTDLAKSVAETSSDSNPAVASIKVLGSAAVGIGVGILSSPFLTPAGGIAAGSAASTAASAALGYIAGKIFEELFDKIRKSIGDIDIPHNTLGRPIQIIEVDGSSKVRILTPKSYSETKINQGVNTCFRDAKGWRQPIDPIMLDLDGDGLELRRADGQILFDHDGDHVRTGTGWISADDGVLVRDINGDGQITSGLELFGDQTIKPNGQRAINGFDALADLDSDQDGNFTSSDTAWSQVQVWRDLNQDGVSDAGELFTLDALGISRIGVVGSTTNGTGGMQAGSTIEGNYVAQSASFTRVVNGQTFERTVGAVDLDANDFHREFLVDVPLPSEVEVAEAIRILPNMQGAGRVRDLHQAATLSPLLAASLTAFSQGSTRDEQISLLDNLITQWARSSDYWKSIEDNLGLGTSGLYGVVAVSINPPAGMTVDQFRNLIAVLEVFNGERFYEAQSTSSVAGLGMQSASSSSGGGVSSLPNYIINPPAAQVDILLQGYDALREGIYGALIAQTRLNPYLESIRLNIDDTGVEFSTSELVAKLENYKTVDERNAFLDLIDLNRYLHSTLQVTGFDGLSYLQDWINELPPGSALLSELVAMGVFLENSSSGTRKSDIYLGSDLANGFSAGAGDDLMRGGAGNDNLDGQSGNDFLDGGLDDDHLYGGDGDDTVLGGEGHDYLQGQAGNDRLYGDNGNDSIYGGDGVDELNGGEGNDYLDGGNGDDILVGGIGNDTLSGGGGADIYRFSRGDGQDVIYNAESVAPGANDPIDILEFGENVSPADIQISRNWYGDLTLSITGTSDRVTISGYFQNDGASSSAIQKIVFTNGTIWGIETIKSMALMANDSGSNIFGFESSDVIDGAAGIDTIYGQGGNDTISGYDGNDGLYGEAGNDILIGGGGRDYLDGGDGDDVLDGGADDDQLVGGAGADIYRFGRGGGKDTINNYEYIASGQANPVDAIVFGADVTPNDIDARRSPWNELVLTIKGTNDVLTVSQYFQSDGTSSYAVEEVRFADGTVWDIAAIKQRVLQPTEGADALTGFNTDDTIYGAGGDDTLQGVGGNDLLDGGEGNDTLFGGEGADQLLGGNGQDRLYGEAGNDTLLGGAGRDILDGGDGDDVLDGGADDDQLVGGAGADIYRFARGGGKDTINNHEYIISGQANPVDAIVFGADIAPNDIEARRSPWGDLVLTIKGTNDVLTVSQYFQNDGASSYAVEEVRFADGTAWDIAAVKLKVLQPTEGADALTGFSTDDTIYGAGGDDTLQGVGGNDLLDGGDGNDTVFGGEGADQLLGGNGQDRLYGEVGNDTLSGGAGQDYLDGGDGDDVLNGGADDDQLVGGAGDDILDGGTGNDILKGGSGNNIYRLSIGGGQDVVVRETFASGATTDTILVPTSVGLQNVEFIREGLDVVFRIKGTQDSIRVLGILTNDGIFENYDFSLKSEDGALLSWDGIKLALLHGDAGDNTLTGYATADTMTGGAGNDLIDGAAGNDTISGNEGDDHLLGNTGSDHLYGNEGNDVLDGGEGDDILVGGTGDDHYVVDSAGDVLIENAGEGNDTVLSSVTFALSDHFENLTLTGDANIDGVGNAADNILIGNSGSNRLVGGQGNDVLDGGLGTDTLEGGEGDDKYYVGQSSDVIIEAADEGYDTVYASADYTLSANLEKLILDANAYGINGTGNAQANEIIGNSSNNRLDGGGGTDVLIGGDGDDTYVIDSADDQIIETAAGGWDTVESYINYQLTDVLEAVTLLGSADLQAFGNSDGNVLQGNTGNNVLDGGAGADTMSGGEGNDTYYVDQEGDSVIEYANQGTDTIIRSFDTTYILESNVENLILAGTVFRGNGNDLDNVITGNDADNNLLGLGGNDTLIGGGGNDALFGSEGQDILIGGTGDDYYEVDDAGDVIIEYGGEGDDFVRSSVSWTLGANVERLALDGTANLSATGNSLDNGLWGNSGNNVLTGGLGSDFLSGGAGNDIYVFNAGDGQDTIDNTDVVGALDTLRFGAGIAESDVLAFKYGDSLFLKIRGTTDQVAISNYFAASTTSNGVSSDRKIDRVEFANGASWDQAMIQTVVDRAINDQAPTINSGLPTLKATQGSAFTYVVPVGTITDPDPWDSVTYSATMANGAPLPSWLTFDPQSRTFSGTPTAGDVGSFQFVLWGTDNYGKSTGTYVNFSVASPNRAPVVSTPIADQTATAGSAFSYTVAAGTFTDPDAGDSLSYVATLANGSALPSWLVFNASTRKFTGTAPAGTAQSLSIKVVATDSGGLSVQDVFDINVVVAGQTLNGTASADTLTGGAGDDTIDGKGGNDTLIGNAGNDRLIGGTGNDTMRGGTGNDTYVVDATGDIVTELANEGIDTVESSITYTLGSNVENLVLTGTAALNGTGNSLANTLTGNSGANTLQGGGGNDTLIGGAGNDLYLFNVGDGQDTIDTQDILSAVDVLRFGTGITSSNVSLARTGDDLVLKINNSSDQVTIAGYFTANTTTGGVTQNRKIDRIEFASGTPWSQADIDAAFNPPAQNHAPEVASYLPTLNATSGQAFTYTVAAGVITDPDPGDTITYSATLADGSALPSWLSFNSSTRTFTGTPQAGNIGNLQFVLWGSDGHGQSVGMYVTLNVASDQPSAFSPSYNFDYVIPDGTSGVTISGNAPYNIKGNSANNSITGNTGANVIYGAGGNDTLTGGAGNDTYLLGRGDGKDVIVENDSTAGNTDVAQFATDIAADQLWFRQVGNNLEVSVIGTNDQFTVNNWYLGNQYHVEQFKSGNGKVLLDSKVQNLVQAMASFSPPAAGQTTLPANYQSSLSGVIAANWQ
ncbi:calcium-binding protein [Comamonas testosteroni]|uniref:calcium-binding protein n=1 Tax=Comamonas testosteroni TaxID=285 RepID=UPI0023AB0F75|nr:calcium-binding protein [Comamonas testosteroni]